MRDIGWIRLGLLALATFVVATLGGLFGGLIAPALGIGFLAPLVVALSSLLAIAGTLVIVDIIYTASSAEGRRQRRRAAPMRSRPTGARSSA